MVAEYYREYDHNEYCKRITELISSSKYRFHLKTLIITSLGEVKKPTIKEKEIVSKFIFTDFDFTRVFINSVFSLGWLEYIINENIPLQYFNYQKKWKHNLYEKLITSKIIKPEFLLKYNYINQKEIRLSLLFRLFINNRSEALNLIINFIEKLPESDEKTNFINKFLINIDDWQNQKLLNLFDTYFYFNLEDKNKDNFWHYQILQKIFIHYPDYVFKKIKAVILKCFDEHSFSINFSHDQEELFKKINEINPDLAFNFFFKIFSEIIEDSKFSSSFEDIDSPLYKSSKFSELFESEHLVYANGFVEDLLSNYIKSKATDKLYLLDFFEQNKNSNSISHLKILILGLSEIPVLYKNEILELIKIIHSKNGFNGYDDKFQLFLRELISKSFSIYSEPEKLCLSKILLSIKHPADVYYYNDSNDLRKSALGFYGKKKYLFIDSLSQKEIESIPILKKVHQELSRKFGKLNEKQLDGSKFTVRGVSAPLSEVAYSFMKNKDWKKSILKFGDNYNHRSFDNFKGGKLEHSRAFEEAVASNPKRFYSLIKELFEIENISLDYLKAGIEGLIKGKYDALLVKEFYLKLVKLNLNLSNTLSSIWIVDYLIDNKMIDDTILNYLCNLALNHPNPDSINNPTDPLFDSLNSVRGAAFHKLIHCNYDPNFKDKIFYTIEQAVGDLQTSVKVAIVSNLEYLNHLDIDRSFNLFIKLTDTNDILLLKNVFRTANYFNNKFYPRMLFLHNKVIENEELHDKGCYLIVHSWLLGYDKNKEFYNRFINSSKIAKLKAIHIAEENLFKGGKIDKKCLDILSS